jgi:hypothetical protein
MNESAQLCEKKSTDPSHAPPSVRSEKTASERDSIRAATEPERHQQIDESFPRPATAEEIRELPHVMSSISVATWLLVFTGAAAAFARYGVTTPFRKSTLPYAHRV